jgi:hypothetical protein
MLSNLVSYVQEYGDENLVILLLGDHPPAPMVSGDPDARQVPIHLIARDAEVIEAVAHWDWQPGMLPGSDAPVWRMDELRDRFVEALLSRLHSVPVLLRPNNKHPQQSLSGSSQLIRGRALTVVRDTIMKHCGHYANARRLWMRSPYPFQSRHRRK